MCAFVRRGRRASTRIAAVALAAGLAAVPAAAADGALDPTFDGDGKVVTDFGSDDSAGV